MFNMRRSALLLAGATVIASAAIAMPKYADWGPPANLAILPGTSPALSTPAVDGCVSWARDGLSLYFTSNRTGDFDIYVATRPTRDVGFGSVTRLPAPINRVGSDEACPTIATGNRLFFHSTKDEPQGDIYVSRRHPTGWTEPERLPADVNSGQLDEAPTFYTDDQGREVMIFSRRPISTNSVGVLMQSVDGGPATLLPGEINATGANHRPTVSRDGKTLYFDTNRFTGGGNIDLAVATRSSLSQPFGNIVHLSSLSSAGFDARPALSFDGRTLAFSSARPGNPSPAPDIWFAEREKANGN